FKTWLPITRTVRNAGQPCRPVARLCITLPSDRRVQKNLTTTDLITRFELEHTPSVITARGKKFVVRELAEEGGE
ncbi:hypothetical protein, partial [Klebsiella pneumoniae]|uniref:hypothetical protein n=1 Tax=Klebsiella pneumoniae TaxID=573 RepID=UPI001BCEDB55